MAATKITGKNMKINERSLISFACSREGIDKEGYLNKKGELSRGYQRHWFVLKGNLLFYYEKAGEKQPVGVIILENCNIEVSDGDRFAFSISFGSASSARTYVLCADSEKEMEQWMKCITAASYKYTQMVVKEFEKTLFRIRENESKMTREAVGDIVDEEPTALKDSSDLLTCTGIDITDRSTSQMLRNSTLRSKQAVAYEIKQSVTQDRQARNMNSKSQSADLLAFANLTMASQKLKGSITRSKSSENIQKLPKSSLAVGQQKFQVKNNNRSIAATSHIEAEIPDLVPSVAYELEKSTFEILHTSFGAAIWTKVGEHGLNHVPLDFSSMLSAL